MSSSLNSGSAGNRDVTGRVALCVSYKGTRYFGWQSQSSGLPTVQDEVQSAISRVANHSVEVVCAGRTDKAVHASYQIVHFDTSAIRSERAWVFGCNANLPPDISVTWARSVSSDFHARFSAFSRRYNYFIYNHPVRPAHFHEEMTWCHFQLDERAMHEAAQSLVGEHDFTSFRAVGCQSRSPFRNIEAISVRRFSNMLVLDIKGNAFLHHMVRNIAGVLMAIGSGNKPVRWCKEVLKARDRTQADVTAPPYGLYLTDVSYPNAFALPLSQGAPAFAQAMQLQEPCSFVPDEEMWSISRLPRE
ncbi:MULTISPECIES: tRNA pseudouridine(38-40) synthase TruA [unclassified Oleiphilus]|uniref:tRNA pseudouridine(38-40) synthase TruA n=1 Tax=unclassified Oleiphilus TaxID=2631174 RepID=UPI0008386922|nr:MULTISPECIES: tRNA pseudouridine(38-40) synthase TruA [unclassified Oleiphilus]